MATDPPPDELAMVYGWMRCLSDDGAAAEDWTLEVMLRYRRQVGPLWLRGRDPLLRLRYLSAQVVLERRGIL